VVVVHGLRPSDLQQLSWSEEEEEGYNMDGHGLLSYLMSTEHAIHDVGSDDIYTYHIHIIKPNRTGR